MNQEQAFKVADLIVAQSNDLWPISVALLVATGLIMVKLLTAQRADTAATVWLTVSMIFNLAALFTAYLVKGALIVELSKARPNGNWSLGDAPGWASICQGVFLLLSLFTLAAAFVRHRAAIASAANRVWGA
jgi:hypothetical protein